MTIIPSKGNQMIGFMRKASGQKNITVPLLLVLVFISSCFLLNRGLTFGHDIEFFIYRLEGTSNSIINGELPDRIQTSQINGYGYPLGIIYCNLLYYPAALLHIAGLSLENCYRLVVLTINLLTVLISAYSFSRILGSKELGCLSTWLYTLAYYRIENITLRADLGEAFGMSFLPLLALSTCLILTAGKSLGGKPSETMLPSWLLFGLSMACIVISNVPLTVICVLFLILTTGGSYIFFPNVRSLSTVCSFVKGASVCILLTAFYSIPLLDYYLNADLAATTGVAYLGTTDTASKYAVAFSQLFSVFTDMVGWASNSSVASMPTCIGLSLVIAPLGFLLVRDSEIRPGTDFIFVAILGSVALFMCTSLFPWNSKIPILCDMASFLAKVQFPWRFLSVATVFFVLLTSVSVEKINADSEAMARYLAIVLIVISSAEALYGITTWVNGNQNVSATVILEGSDGAADGICLPAATYQNRPDFSENTVLTDSNQINVSSFSKQGTRISLSVESSGDGKITLPLLNYRYYKASSADGGLAILLESDSCGRIVLDVSGVGTSSIVVDFCEPLLWRFAEFTSLVSFIVVALYILNRAEMRALC